MGLRTQPLEGRVALVTGVSRRAGIGTAIARRLLSDGACVLVSGFQAHDEEMPWKTDPGGALAELARHEAAVARLRHHDDADFEDPQTADRLVAATVERFGRIDIVVTNHAHSGSQSFEEMTATLADAMIERGVTVNCINPGPTDTGYATDPDAALVAGKFPARRWGSPDDVANLVAWLVSDEAAWVMGQVHDSEGGFRR